MIINLFVLFGFLFHEIFCHFIANDSTAETSVSSLRFANLDFLTKDESLIQLFSYRSKGDEGLKIPHYRSEIVSENLDPTKKTVVLFNGHPSSDSREPFMDLKDVYLDAEPVNVIFVYIDWTKHHITFLDAVALSDSFGQFIGNMFTEFRIPNDHYHFIGHCVGAEIAVATAKYMTGHDEPKISRMTVFDPFVTNSTKLLQTNEWIDFTDVYHAGIYTPPFAPVGDVDFYPNAGVRQPGCHQIDVLQKYICHHRRSIQLYTESIHTGIKALEANYDEPNKYLTVKDDPGSITFGHFVERGHFGAYYLPTYMSEPFLMDYF